MAEHKRQKKNIESLELRLTEDQQQAIQKFWHETGSVGTAEILINVVNDRISPASIQVGTAK